MTRSIVEQTLQAMTAPRGWDFEGLDVDGCAFLGGPEGPEVLLTYMPAEAPSLVLYAELGEPVDPLAAYREALRAMHLWRAGDGITLGVLPDDDQLSACLMLPVDEAFADDFAEAFDHFCDRVRHWEERLAGGASAPGDRGAEPSDPERPNPNAVRV